MSKQLIKDDSFRNKLTTQMVCTRHPHVELYYSTNSILGANSAYELSFKISVYPCRECEHELYKIKNAVKLFGSIAKELDEKIK